MSANNSISQLLEQFLELNTNSLETFNRINEAITTDKETVTLELFDTDTETRRTVQIPAFGYLKREIDRLNKNVQQISGVEGTSANVRLKDGSFRKIHTTKLKGPSKSINQLAAPTQFNTKLNEFFEDFLNPLLTIKLDVSNQIPVETEKVYIERYIIDNDDPTSIDQFEETYKGQSELVYETFKNEAISNNLKYYVDSEVVEMPIRTIQYTGSFDVTNITNEQKTQVIDGVSQTKTIKLFTLNKLTYNDTSKNQKDTEVLKTNDSLIINSGEYRTRYRIKAIDASTSQVELELIEGYEAINLGANVLSIYKDVNIALDVEIKLGFNERQIVFIKPIDPDSNIPAEDFSPGIGFYSNELTLTQNDGTTVSLAQYYRDEVDDFGELIRSLKVDYIPPSSVGLTPNVPTLNPENFKVVQINKHLTDNTTTKKIKQLKSDKLATEQNIKKLDEAIKQKKNALNSRKFQSQIEKDKEKNELSSLITEREDESKLFSSAVADIRASAESTDLSKVSPKFRVRGFWSVPQPRVVGNQVSQSIVRFKIRYRYVSTSGKTSEVEQINFNDTVNDTNKTGAFSNWVEVEGPIRKRGKNDQGVYEWMSESEEDAQAVNFNSLDIPINSGEIVEIMVKSVSEAGFPSNPVMSDWSEITRIEFPEGELATDSLSDLVTSNELDKLKVDLESDLETQGVFQHIDGSFTANSKFYAHSATELASGFLTQEQAPVSVYDKLVQLQNEILKLKGELEAAEGELEVRLIDEDGNVKPIKNNTKNKVFAGYYINELPETNAKGFIVTKNFKIELSNTKASNLELIARITGDRQEAAYTSTDNTIFGLGDGAPHPKVVNDTYYTNEGKYDLVPIVYQNLSGDEVNGSSFNFPPNQSSQLRSQFIYSRFANLADDKNLYVVEDIDISDDTGYTLYEYGLSYNFGTVDQTLSNDKDYSNADLTALASANTTDSDFIWSGTNDNGVPLKAESNTISNDDYDNGLYMHIDHPILDGQLNALEIQSNGMIGIPKTATKTFSENFGRVQTAFKTIESVNNEGNTGLRTSIKNSFEPNDQYLLGGHSCGSFLYLSPIESDSIVVDADNKTGKKIINTGKPNAISLDLIFQYRMTDYHGVGDTGTGRIAGLLGTSLQNLTYGKTIGFDIQDSQVNEFKFDIDVSAKYRPTGSNINSIGASQLSNYNNFASSSSNGSSSLNAFLSDSFGFDNVDFD